MFKTGSFAVRKMGQGRHVTWNDVIGSDSHRLGFLDFSRTLENQPRSQGLFPGLVV